MKHVTHVSCAEPMKKMLIKRLWHAVLMLKSVNTQMLAVLHMPSTLASIASQIINNLAPPIFFVVFMPLSIWV